MRLTCLLTLSWSDEQFHRLDLNWYWHSSIALTAPSLTEAMNPGLRLQNLTCFFMSDPFIWSHTSGSRDELAIALTCETASHLIAETCVKETTTQKITMCLDMVSLGGNCFVILRLSRALCAAASPLNGTITVKLPM